MFDAVYCEINNRIVIGHGAGCAPKSDHMGDRTRPQRSRKLSARKELRDALRGGLRSSWKVSSFSITERGGGKGEWAEWVRALS